jgi:transposase
MGPDRPTLTAWQQARLAKRATDAPTPTDLRSVINALPYLYRTGISWRYIPTITKAWADQGFKNKFVEHAATLGVNAEAGLRNPGTRGFHVLKRRWVVERAFGWLMFHRRLARDYETLPASSEAMIHLAMIDNVGSLGSPRISSKAFWRTSPISAATCLYQYALAMSQLSACPTYLASQMGRLNSSFILEAKSA